jgi:hypothetical protein
MSNRASSVSDEARSNTTPSMTAIKPAVSGEVIKGDEWSGIYLKATLKPGKLNKGYTHL